MSLHYYDFAKENATLIGSPASAPAAMPAAFRYPAGEFVNRLPVDPARHPADLRLAVRASVQTERRLSAIARLMGFEFWGQAAALVLGYAAAFPDEFDSRGLDVALGRRMVSGEGFSKAGRGNSVAGILVPLTRDTSEFVGAVAARQRVTRKVAASLILHRHVARVAALLGA